MKESPSDNCTYRKGYCVLWRIYPVRSDVYLKQFGSDNFETESIIDSEEFQERVLQQFEQLNARLDKVG